MCFKHILWKKNERKKKSHFLPEGLKRMFCSLRNNTVNQHSSKWESQALEMANPAGKGWGIHLLIFNHTAQRSCAGSQPLLLALLRALQEWEPSLGVSTDTGPGQAHGFHQHFTISKCILPHRAYWARTFSPLLSLWDINLIMVGAFLTYRNKSAWGRPPVILWFFFPFPGNSLCEAQSAWKPTPLCSSQCRLHAVQLGANMEIKRNI